MSKAFPIQTNFTSGEVSKHISARTDVAKYFNGAEIIENFIPKAQGGLVRRSGTRFIKEVKNSDKLTIIRRFEFSVLQAYVIEFGDMYIRIFRDRGVLETSPGTPYELATPYKEADLRDLKFTQSADVLYITHNGYATLKLSRLGDTNWSLTGFDNQDGPYLSRDPRGFNLTVSGVNQSAVLNSTTSEFAVGDVGKYVEFIYQGDTLIGEITQYNADNEVVVDPKFNVVDPVSLDSKAVILWKASGTPAYDRLLSSTSIWSTETENSYIKVGGSWYLTIDHKEGTEAHTGTGLQSQSMDVMEVGTALTMVSTSGVLTLSQVNITGSLFSSGEAFDSVRDVGRHVRLSFGEQKVWAKITDITDVKTAKIKLGRQMPNDPADPSALINGGKTSDWQFGAWYEGNYPGVVTFHEERIVFANTPLQPQTMWFSVSADYENMAPTDIDSQVLDDSAMTYTMASKQVNAIYWLESGPVLLIGTSGGEWQAKASTINETITPTNINIKPQTPYGSVPSVAPQRIGSSLLFAERSGVAIRELTYSFELDSYVGSDKNILSEHIIRQNGQIVDSCFVNNPDSILWCITSLGKLLGFTYEKEQEVGAWFRCPIDGTVESIACIPSVEGVRDELYLVVNRSINGVQKRFVEVLERNFTFDEPGVDYKDIYFVDSGLTYDGALTTTITGLDHLDGETVSVVADGSVITDKVVSSGSITLDKAASRVHVGLPFTSRVRILPLEAGVPEGTAQGKIKRVSKLDVRLFESLGFKHGPSLDDLIPVSFRDAGDPMDAPPTIYSGDKSLDLDMDYNTLGQYEIVQDQAYPLTVLALMAEVEAHQ